MKIGLSQRILYHKGRAYDSLEHGWYSYLKEHALFAIPNRLDHDFNLLADNLDAFIITGGDDSMLRRTVETKLAAQLLTRNKPIIGICHGAFLLTDLLGGIVSDIANHSNTIHEVKYAGQTYSVNSYHTLCIDTPHSRAQVLAVDPEGHCESWIDGNIAAVVWHPERMLTPWIPDEIRNLLWNT